MSESLDILPLLGPKTPVLENGRGSTSQWENKGQIAH